MLSNRFIEKCEEFIEKLSGCHDSGHDISHIRRVRYNSRLINDHEKAASDDLLDLCAIFHDVADHKFIADPSEVIDQTREFLSREGITEELISRIIYVAENISFSKGDKRGESTPELRVVMDADRLDAMGAIGIARAFTYGGFRRRPLYGEEMEGTTIGHFSEKLLLLKDLMSTEAGKEMALERHQYMLDYLKQFERETGIEPATLSLGS